MCGIAGFYNNDSKYSNEILSIARRMGDAISHRGPDNFDFWTDNSSPLTLLHRRLAILDLSEAGNQPMHSPSNRYVISYNGEIYNHLDIRREIDKDFSDVKWLSQSDTETIIIAIEVWGIKKSLQAISGMFAIAIWDKKLKTLHLARDRVGEKPLYYGWQNNVFLFASELKAIKAHPSFEGKIDRNSINMLMQYGYIPAPYSVYKKIFKLEPGKLLSFNFQLQGKDGFESIEDYWSFQEVAKSARCNQFQGGFKEAKIKLNELLIQSISSQMISDVPIGAFLSGGIDSSLIVSLMQACSDKPINTFTIGFSEDKYNEADFAKEIAKYLGTNHSEYYVSSSEALDVIPKLPHIYDEPFADSSQIPTYLVSKLAKSSVTVSLSGDAGDELFGGYNRHVYSYRWGNILRKTPKNFKLTVARLLDLCKPDYLNQLESRLSKKFISKTGINNLSNFFNKTSTALKLHESKGLYQSFITHWPKDSNIVLHSNSYSENLFADDNFSLMESMMMNDFMSYLHNDILVKVDRAAMGLSLETRVPFLNEDIIRFAWTLPNSMKVHNGKGKYILRSLLNEYIPKKYFDRPKQGFAVPIEDWLRGPLLDWAESLLSKSKLDEQGYLNSNIVREKWDEHKSGKKNWQTDLWDVLMLQAWLEDQ
jgi:asparagine synthase (glutamine-hydrolysing)